MNCVDDFLSRKSMDRRFVRASACAHLGDNGEPLRIRMERLPDDLIGDVRAIEIAGINVVDAGSYRLAQDCNCGGQVPGGPRLAGPRVDGAIAIGSMRATFRGAETCHRDLSSAPFSTP